MKSATASMPVTDFVAPELPAESEEAAASKCGQSSREGELAEPCAQPAAARPL